VAVVFWAIGHEEYFLSTLFGVVFTALADPGGSFGRRVSSAAIFALIGGSLTALGFGIGGDAWGGVVLAAFVTNAYSWLAGSALRLRLTSMPHLGNGVRAGEVRQLLSIYSESRTPSRDVA